LIDNVTECARCLYNSSHPFGLTFDADGVCSGCRVHEEKDIIDWCQKEKELIDELSRYKSKSSTNYDCIIPVTGAGDSFYIVHLAKNVFGMNPLLVHYNNGWNTSTGIDNLAKLRTVFDCDIITKTISTSSRKKIVRETLYTMGSIYWHSIAGRTALPVQVAVDYDIPLIIWGAHQGLEQVGMVSHDSKIEMSRWYRTSHDLMGREAESLVKFSNTLTDGDVAPFMYPPQYDIQTKGIKGIYLGNYIRWDPWAQHKKMVELYNYKGICMDKTFDPYDHCDCVNYLGIHDFLKQIKVGYGKVTDQLCREIRHNRIDKKSAKKLRMYYEGSAVQGVDLFLDWLGVPKTSFDFILRQLSAEKSNKNNDLYSKNVTFNTKRSFTGSQYINELPEALVSNCKDEFLKTKNYIIIGKGEIN